MDFLKEHKKKAFITLACALALGGVSYGIAQNQSSKSDHSVSQSQDKEKDTTKKSVLDRINDPDNHKIIDKAAKGSEKGKDIIFNAQGADKELLSPKIIADDLSNFDKNAQKSDIKRASDKLLIPKSNNKVERLDFPTSKSDTRKDTEKESGRADERDKKVPQGDGTDKNVTPTPTPTPNPTPTPTPTPTPKPEPAIPTDYSTLVRLSEQAKQFSKEEYVTETFQALETERNFSERLLSDRNATQEQVNQQVQRLKQAIDNLVRRGDKGVLLTKLSEAAALDRAIYTKETLDSLDAIVSVGKTISDNIDATQDQINEVTSQMIDALNALKKIDEPDLTLVYLNRLIQECEQINLSEYTPQSVVDYQLVFEQVKEFVSKTDVTEEAAKQQLEALQNAKNQLVKKANKADLQTLVDESKTLNQVEYTANSWQVFSSALTSAEQVLSDENATQTQVDAAKDTLNHAKNDLTKETTEDE